MNYVRQYCLWLTATYNEVFQLCKVNVNTIVYETSRWMFFRFLLISVCGASCLTLEGCRRSKCLKDHVALYFCTRYEDISGRSACRSALREGDKTAQLESLLVFYQGAKTSENMHVCPVGTL